MIKKIVAFGLLLVMSFGIFCGCKSEDPKVGTFEGLSYETERQICEAYYELLCKKYEDYDGKIEDINIRGYYGTYNGYPAVQMNGGWGFAYFLFDGIFFSLHSVHEIMIFKDNQLIDFVDAYNDGFLTREDLRSLQNKNLSDYTLDDLILGFNEKTIWGGSIDEDFDDQTIIVTILKDFTNYAFKCALERNEYGWWENSTGDFASINAISVEEISGDRPKYSEETKEEWEAYRKILEVKIADKGKQNVIDTIRRLEDFDFVQSATPKYN